MALWFLWECFPLSPAEATRPGEVGGHSRIWQHPSSPQINLALCLPHCLSCLVHVLFFFAEHPKWKNKTVISSCFCFPTTAPRCEIALIHPPSPHTTPRPTDGGEASFPICSYQPGFTQLPSGIFVTLHKIVMTSAPCWALPFHFFPPLFQGTTSPPSQRDLIDALGARPHVKHEDDSKSILKSTFFFYSKGNRFTFFNIILKTFHILNWLNSKQKRFPS